MLKFSLVLFLALAASAIPVKEVTRDEMVIKGTAGVTYFNVKGMLVPMTVPNVDYRTFSFQAEDDVEFKDDEFETFKCMPLQEIYVAKEDTHKAALFCRGSVFEDEKEKKMVFLFATDGLTFTPEEKEIHLKLGPKTISNLYPMLKTYDDGRVKRQFGGGGFSGSGAQAGASSFGSGSGGGFPGGFGGGMSGSQAQAGASSFGSGGGFFG